MKSLNLQAFLLFVVVIAAFAWMRSLPQVPARRTAEFPLRYASVSLPSDAASPLQLVGAWVMTADDPRLQGLSGLAIDGDGFAAVSDVGFAARFSRPDAAGPKTVRLSDLRDGPGPFGRKVYRDAEALVRDSKGDGWWVAYEQNHSLWHYGRDFARADRTLWLSGLGWRDNKGAEGLAMVNGRLTAFAEQSRETVDLGPPLRRIPIVGDWDIADAANAPDGSVWVLLRRDFGGVEAIAPLLNEGGKWRIGEALSLPKGLFDNFEGMAIAPRPGGWRFWLVTDDGHRFMARTLLVALDLDRARQNARR